MSIFKRPKKWFAEYQARRTELNEERLFLLLDYNHAKYMGDLTFWSQLHALDKEVRPNGIYQEPFQSGQTLDLDPLDGSEEVFCKGTPTVVIEVNDRKSAVIGAKLLNKIFTGSGTRFVAEARVKNGYSVPLIRSNIDKQHWDKLCVYCHYCFNREVNDPLQVSAYKKETATMVHQYVAGSPYRHWKPLEGVPAFVTLIGLPGILRPAIEQQPNLDRKQHEFEIPHARGNPFLFDDISVHVELKSSNSQEVCFTPYHYGFNPMRKALREATDGASYWELMLETFGGNPFQKHIASSRRSIYAIGLGLGLYGASKGAVEMIAWIGPAASMAVAGSFVVFTIVDHTLRVSRRIDNIRRDSPEMKALVQEYAGAGGRPSA